MFFPSLLHKVQYFNPKSRRRKFIHTFTISSVFQSIFRIFQLPSSTQLHFVHEKIPETPSVTLSIAPPFEYAITGVPEAIASRGTIPKSST